MVCNNCNYEVDDSRPVCAICNYPVLGTEQEQSTFIASQVIQKSEVEESFGKLKKARQVLFAIGAVNLIIPLTPLMPSKDLLSVILTILIGVFFIGFGFLTSKKPLVAIAVPLGLVILYYLLLLISDPGLLFKGIIWKVMIITGLTYGYMSVRKANKILKENSYLASKLGFGEIKHS